jgi:MFS family permease
MYSESDLDAAVAGGALTPEAAQAFRNHVAAGHHSPAVDEEHFRLLTGFNDIFVAIAAAILLVAVGWIGYYLPPHIDGDGPTPFIGLFVAASAWGLAEYFTRQRRMALPSILLLLAFVGGVQAFSLFAIITGVGEAIFKNDAQASILAIALSAAIATGAAWLHWRRFKVPITIAVGAGAAVALILGLVASAFVTPEMTEEAALNVKSLLEGVALVLGLFTFLLAMRWDASDPKRETRRSDVAFWLHLLAAPLIVHPIFSLLGLTEGAASTLDAIAVVLLYVALGLVALAIDRRALLVSALAYVLFALNSLFETYGVVELSVALTALVIGSALLLLSAFWASARRAVVSPLPDGLRGKLPVIDRARALPAAA